MFKQWCHILVSWVLDRKTLEKLDVWEEALDWDDEAEETW